MNTLDDLRKQIDAIDAEILALLDKRMQTAAAIGAAKKTSAKAVLDPTREYEVLQRLLNLAGHTAVSSKAVLGVYGEIMRAARAMQGDQNEVNAVPRLYAVLGHPVGHSLSPAMHNRAFGFMEYPGLFFALDTTEPCRALKAFKELNFGGAAVTMPHKEAVMACLDRLEGVAQDIGAVNTVVNRNGRLTGYNTDSEGAMNALKAQTPIAGKTVLLLGAGGAAKALAFGLKAENAHIIIANRSAQKGAQLAKAVEGRFAVLNDILDVNCDIVINATSLGMYPHVNESAVPESLFKPGMVAMDIVYNPLQTKFLRNASAKGALTVDGVSMFIYQGARQFELWTGLPAPLSLMRQTVLSFLQ